ncbi:hypothetical protein EI555_018696, partial [Monodon monoceros]
MAIICKGVIANITHFHHPKDTLPDFRDFSIPMEFSDLITKSVIESGAFERVVKPTMLFHRKNQRNKIVLLRAEKQEGTLTKEQRSLTQRRSQVRNGSHVMMAGPTGGCRGCAAPERVVVDGVHTGADGLLLQLRHPTSNEPASHTQQQRQRQPQHSPGSIPLRSLLSSLLGLPRLLGLAVYCQLPLPLSLLIELHRLRQDRIQGVIVQAQPLQTPELSKADRQGDQPAVEEVQVPEVDQEAETRWQLPQFVLTHVQLHQVCEAMEIRRKGSQFIAGRIQYGGLWGDSSRRFPPLVTPGERAFDGQGKGRDNDEEDKKEEEKYWSLVGAGAVEASFCEHLETHISDSQEAMPWEGASHITGSALHEKIIIREEICPYEPRGILWEENEDGKFVVFSKALIKISIFQHQKQQNLFPSKSIFIFITDSTFMRETKFSQHYLAVLPFIKAQGFYNWHFDNKLEADMGTGVTIMDKQMNDQKRQQTEREVIKTQKQKKASLIACCRRPLDECTTTHRPADVRGYLNNAVAPSLTVMEAAHFFEGTEKLLEVWFSRQQPDATQGFGDLRTIPRYKWDILLKDVQCSVISVTKTDKQEAYVLSESSMFASKRRFILKTCGTTLLLKAPVPLLKLARDYNGFDSIQSFFYFRKNFMKPVHQGYPHGNFQEEIEFLNAIFPNGAAYCMGHMNSDCWYLYTLDFPESRGISQPYQTLEILMSELDPAVMDQFYMKDGVTAKDVTHESRICDLIPGSVIDATLFDPCGYSMNGMKSDGIYRTIHIYPHHSRTRIFLYDLIRKVVEVFKPGKFVTTLFANQSSKCRTVLSSPQKTEGFKGLDCQSALLSDNNFVFTSFAKKHQQQQRSTLLVLYKILYKNWGRCFGTKRTVVVGSDQLGYGGFRQPQRGIHTCEGIHSYRKFGGTSMQQTEVFTSQNSEEESSNGSGSGKKLWPYIQRRPMKLYPDKRILLQGSGVRFQVSMSPNKSKSMYYEKDTIVLFSVTHVKTNLRREKDILKQTEKGCGMEMLSARRLKVLNARSQDFVATRWPETEFLDMPWLRNSNHLQVLTGLRFKLQHTPFQGKTDLLQLTGQEARPDRVVQAARPELGAIVRNVNTAGPVCVALELPEDVNMEKSPSTAHFSNAKLISSMLCDTLPKFPTSHEIELDLEFTMKGRGCGCSGRSGAHLRGDVVQPRIGSSGAGQLPIHPSVRHDPKGGRIWTRSSLSEKQVIREDGSEHPDEERYSDHHSLSLQSICLRVEASSAMLTECPEEETSPAEAACGLAPGPRVPVPAPDPASSRPRSPPTSTAGAQEPARLAHRLPTRNRNWPVGGTRAMASGRGQESRRGDGKRLRAASKGFKDNNKKMATTQLLLRTPSPKVPQCPGGVEAEEWRATPRAGRGVRADLHAPPAKDTTRRAEGDAENLPAPGEPAPPPPALTGRGARLIGFNGPEKEEAKAAVAEAAGRVRGAARAVPAPAGSRVTRAAETRGGGGGWVREAGPLRIPRGRHWPAAGIVRRASPAATLRRSVRRGVPAEPGAAAAPLTRAGRSRRLSCETLTRSKVDNQQVKMLRKMIQRNRMESGGVRTSERVLQETMILDRITKTGLACVSMLYPKVLAAKEKEAVETTRQDTLGGNIPRIGRLELRPSNEMREVENFKLLRLSIATDRDPRALSQNEEEGYLSDCEENRNKTKQKNVYSLDKAETRNHKKEIGKGAKKKKVLRRFRKIFTLKCEELATNRNANFLKGRRRIQSETQQSTAIDGDKMTSTLNPEGNNEFYRVAPEIDPRNLAITYKTSEQKMNRARLQEHTDFLNLRGIQVSNKHT